MTTVSIISDPRDEHWRSIAAHAFTAVGLAVVASPGTAPLAVDVICLLWRENALMLRDAEALADTCRRVVVNMDGTVPTHPLASGATVIQASWPGSVGDPAEDDAAWQRLAEAIVPDLLCDTAAIRTEVRSAVLSLKSWLYICRAYTLQAWYGWPSASQVYDFLPACLTWSFVAASVILLFALAPGAALLLVLAYVVAMVIYMFVAGPHYFVNLERLFHIEDAMDRRWTWPPLLGVPYLAVGMFAVLVDGRFNAMVIAVLVIAVYISFVGLVVAGLVLFHVAHLMRYGWRRVLFRLARASPQQPLAFYISYPRSLGALIGLIQSELAAQDVQFHDCWAVRQASADDYLRPAGRRRIECAVRRSSIMLTFSHGSHRTSDWTVHERRMAALLGRPVLEILVSDRPADEDGMAWCTIDLRDHIREALAVHLRSQQADGDRREWPARHPFDRLREDLTSFLGRLCPMCHGHGRDSGYGGRFVPLWLQPKCADCAGLGARHSVYLPKSGRSTWRRKFGFGTPAPRP